MSESPQTQTRKQRERASRPTIRAHLIFLYVEAQVGQVAVQVGDVLLGGVGDKPAHMRTETTTIEFDLDKRSL